MRLLLRVCPARLLDALVVLPWSSRLTLLVLLSRSLSLAYLAAAVSSATSVSPPPASVSPPPAEALAAADYEAQIKDLEARVADLTAENAVLKQQLAELRAPVDVRPSDAASIAVAVAVTEVECSVSALAGASFFFPFA